MSLSISLLRGNPSSPRMAPAVTSDPSGPTIFPFASAQPHLTEVPPTSSSFLVSQAQHNLPYEQLALPSRSHKQYPDKPSIPSARNPFDRASVATFPRTQVPGGGSFPFMLQYQFSCVYAQVAAYSSLKGTRIIVSRDVCAEVPATSSIKLALRK